MKYGCPKCGCDNARSGSFITGGTYDVTCRECNEPFVILADGVKQSSIGFGTDKKDGEGNPICEYPMLQEHPRKGTPWHAWVQPDPRPEYGEYWYSRGIGYDLSGFVKSKLAGERLLLMVKEVLIKSHPDSWLDYREHEPEWIQFKFQGHEFDLEKLQTLAKANGDILTKEILLECKR